MLYIVIVGGDVGQCFVSVPFVDETLAFPQLRLTRNIRFLFFHIVVIDDVNALCFFSI